MKRYLLAATVAIAAVVAAPSQAATTINLLPVGNTLVGAFGNLNPGPGEFTDTFTFTVPSGTVDSGILSVGFNLFRTNLDFSSVKLNGVAFDIVTSGVTEIRALANLPVSAGLQTLVIKGNAQRNATYGGGLTFVPGAVPEPATWAMMIGGFGLVGGAMRRRATVSVTYA